MRLSASYYVSKALMIKKLKKLNLFLNSRDALKQSWKIHHDIFMEAMMVSTNSTNILDN